MTKKLEEFLFLTFPSGLHTICQEALDTHLGGNVPMGLA